MPELSHDRVGEAVFRALDPAPEDFMKEPVPGGPGHQQAVRAMVDLLEYRLLEDLARAWRVAQPNLERCGLLGIHYDGLAELAADDALCGTCRRSEARVRFAAKWCSPPCSTIYEAFSRSTPCL